MIATIDCRRGELERLILDAAKASGKCECLTIINITPDPFPRNGKNWKISSSMTTSPKIMIADTPCAEILDRIEGEFGLKYRLVDD